ncbi:GerAB/ArcD/ProY family transporter [Bacillus paranthracis]
MIFERFESLLLVIWIMQIFATYTISYYAAALGLAQLFKRVFIRLFCFDSNYLHHCYDFRKI